jgi:hypothetical protein
MGLRGRGPRYNADDLRRAVTNSDSMASALRMLGLAPAGGNYSNLRRRIRALGIDTSHWAHAARSRSRPTRRSWARYSLDEICIEHSTYRGTGTRLKARLVRAGLLQYRCATCGLADWLGAPIALHLDHANGIGDDNRLANLRLLCPNCHSQTETYTGRNIGRYIDRARGVVREATGAYVARGAQVVERYTRLS